MLDPMKRKYFVFFAGTFCIAVSFTLSTEGFTLLSAGLAGAGLAFLLTGIPI